MCTMILKESIAYYVNHNSSVYCTFLDASKAFDRVAYCQMFRLLIKRRLPTVVIRFLFIMYSVSQKNPPYGFLKFFPKWFRIFEQFFTHLLCDHFYTRLQIFIQLSPTLTKLCLTKRDHLANFYISLEL